MTDRRQATKLINELVTMVDYLFEHQTDIEVEKIHKVHDLMEKAWAVVERRGAKRERVA